MMEGVVTIDKSGANKAAQWVMDFYFYILRRNPTNVHWNSIGCSSNNLVTKLIIKFDRRFRNVYGKTKSKYSWKPTQIWGDSWKTSKDSSRCEWRQPEMEPVKLLRVMTELIIIHNIYVYILWVEAMDVHR